MNTVKKLKKEIKGFEKIHDDLWKDKNDKKISEGNFNYLMDHKFHAQQGYERELEGYLKALDDVLIVIEKHFGDEYNMKDSKLAEKVKGLGR